MKKRAIFWASILAIFILLIISSNPLQIIFDFIIAGIIPGTGISLGFVPSLAVIFGLILVMKHLARPLKFQMLRRQALLTNAENVARELSTAHQVESKERRAVITSKSLNQRAA